MKENSIEEDIKNAEHFIKSIKTDKEYKEDGWHGYYNKEIVELARILQHILSDYKRVLKENEELLQEKINNQKIIALAQNDMLNYQAGFEDGKNGRTSAVQSIIENQQYYIFQKQIEKYERHIEKLQKENEELKEDRDKFKKALLKRITYCNELEKDLFENGSNYVIPIQTIKGKIEELKQEKEKYGNCLIEMYEDELANRDIKILQELLEGRK